MDQGTVPVTVTLQRGSSKYGGYHGYGSLSCRCSYCNSWTVNNYGILVTPLKLNLKDCTLITLFQFNVAAPAKRGLCFCPNIFGVLLISSVEIKRPLWLSQLSVRKRNDHLLYIYIKTHSIIATGLNQNTAESHETPPTGAILCVFIVDMTLHLFEMMYKSVTELRTAQTR